MKSSVNVDMIQTKCVFKKSNSKKIKKAVKNLGGKGSLEKFFALDR